MLFGDGALIALAVVLALHGLPRVSHARLASLTGEQLQNLSTFGV